MSSNLTSINQSDVVEYGSSLFGYTGTMAMTIIGFLIIPIACAAGFLNSTLFWAIYKVHKTQLRAKYFIQNMSLAHMVLPICSSLTPTVITLVFRIQDPTIVFCYEGVYLLVMLFLYSVQPCCALVLTLDRVYSTAKPLFYNAVGYPKFALFLLLAFPWVTVSFIGLTFLIVNVTGETLVAGSPTGFPSSCAYAHGMFDALEHMGINDNIIVVCYSLAFILSLCVILIIRKQQREITSISSKSANNTIDTTLFVTYLLINLSSVVLYLPGPVYSRIVGGYFQRGNLEAYFLLEIGLVLLFQCNSIIDPLIMLHRVPSIRRKWFLIWKKPNVTTS